MWENEYECEKLNREKEEEEENKIGVDSKINRFELKSIFIFAKIQWNWMQTDFLLWGRLKILVCSSTIGNSCRTIEGRGMNTENIENIRRSTIYRCEPLLKWMDATLNSFI